MVHQIPFTLGVQEEPKRVCGAWPMPGARAVAPLRGQCPKAPPWRCCRLDPPRPRPPGSVSPIWEVTGSPGRFKKTKSLSQHCAFGLLQDGGLAL